MVFLFCGTAEPHDAGWQCAPFHAAHGCVQQKKLAHLKAAIALHFALLQFSAVFIRVSESHPQLRDLTDHILGHF
jgi:hypothetical protein